jgi:hypothetical protein
VLQIKLQHHGALDKKCCRKLSQYVGNKCSCLYQSTTTFEEGAGVRFEVHISNSALQRAAKKRQKRILRKEQT